ncbi:hypothetical protein HCK00_12375 [Streptomyces sp. PLAI1-29]|uniref:UvrD-like helicase C-terminal domain-containing protein n=1 Tax=Streptomyces zingiberis TaxID=2053010 RepID=A0ABX1BUA1_9ACTN|nr:hypothetical protein [Streptomyces zingiberis]
MGSAGPGLPRRHHRRRARRAARPDARRTGGAAAAGRPRPSAPGVGDRRAVHRRPRRGRGPHLAADLRGGRGAAKGLEFRCVAVIGAGDGVLPFPKAVTPPEVNAKQHDTDLMAERCLLFVACTRARDSLYVSWSGEPSPFLVEAGVRGLGA